MHKYMKYPEPAEQHSGCKVGWHIYRTLSEADQCAEAARHNARIRLDQGYDFGWQVPGNITELTDGRYMVVIP